MSHNNQHIDFNDHKFIKGILLLSGGVLLLLYSLNAVNFGINVLLIISAVLLILYGAMVSGLAHTIRRFIDHVRKQ